MSDIRARSGWPVHTKQLILHTGYGSDAGGNPLCQSNEIRIEGAEDHSAMILNALAVELNEMPPIVRQQNAILYGGESETSGSGIAELAFPASRDVSTSCPRRRSSKTSGSAMFSLE